MNTESRGEALKPLFVVLESLIQQRRNCGGDSCKRPGCKRCVRAALAQKRWEKQK